MYPDYLVVIRNGNKISLVSASEMHDENMIKNGMGIYMFERLSGETLENAIKRVAGIQNSGDCYIESATDWLP